MQDEPAENISGTDAPDAAVNDDLTGAEVSPETENEQQSQTPERPGDQFGQIARDSQVGIMSAITGSHATSYFTSISNQSQQPSLDELVSFSKLESPRRTYQSLEPLNLLEHSGLLHSERILLLSCHDENVALNVAQSIAHQTNISNKEQVSIDETSQGRYNFRNFINSLGRPKEKRKSPSPSPTTICVWDATETDENASGILNSLLARNSQISQYKCWLVERALWFICIASPERVDEYKDLHSGSLRILEIDFLAPLLEHYEIDDYEQLAATIRKQRKDGGSWSDNDVDFYKEIIRHLKAGDLSNFVANKTNADVPAVINVEDLFTRQDPLVDTVLYCATYFTDLSPQDFFYLVELFLGEETEEVIKRVNGAAQGNGTEEVVESIPLVNRWRREAHVILRRCKLAAVNNEDDMRVIEFQPESLRHRLRQFIPDFDPYFYDSKFIFARQQGLLFSPKKAIAEGAGQLLVDIGKQSRANDVANWLYEVVDEFEEMAQAVDYLAEMRPLFHLLPDLKVKVARRYVAYGLSKVLTRCEKEPKLREAVRLFWQRLLHNQHQWFLDLLRRMNDAAPAESLKWLRQLIDQGTELIRRQARSYLIAYLLHRDSIYLALKELMQWPKSTPAGGIVRQALILYCAETNRQVAPQDYGHWPSLHPLFGFQNRSEAEECLGLLVGWVYSAASEVDAEHALYIVADIVAGWYFILSSTYGDDDMPQVAGEVISESELNTRVVRELLFECLIQHGVRANVLPEIWEHFKNDILDKIIQLDTFINETSTFAANPDDVANATTARRKLFDTRAVLSDLRHAFIEWVAQAAPTQG